MSLFKDNVKNIKPKSKKYGVKCNELLKTDNLQKTLLGELMPKENKEGKNDKTYHFKCKKILNKDINIKNFDDEERIMRCFYFRNKKPKECNVCDFSRFNYFLQGCDVIEYQVPPYYTTNGVGKFDLIIKYNNAIYAIEAKPFSNPESLLRMISEILTYDICTIFNGNGRNLKLNKNNIQYDKLGLMIFEGSSQYKEYIKLDKESPIKKLLETYKIEVFIIKNNGYCIK